MIKHLRLINGDEIIGNVPDIIDPTGDVQITNPLMVQERQTERGTVAIVLLRYIPFANNKTITLQKNHIIATTTLHPSIEKYYINSLDYSEEFEREMIESIDHANRAMEQQQSKQPMSYDLQATKVLKDNNEPLFIHKGPNTKQ